MRQFLESLAVFVIVLGVWVVFAALVATLASFLPKEEMVAFVGGGISMLGLFLALGVAAQIVGRRLARFSDSPPETHKRTQ